MNENDPLDLGGLEPQVILNEVESKKKSKGIHPPEIAVAKEARLMAKEKRLAITQQASIPVPTPPPEKAPPTVEDKGKLLDKIMAYRERFPDLRKRNNVSAKSAIEDIQDELYYIEAQLGSKSDGSVGAMALQSLMVAIETIHRDVWNPLNLDLNGLSTVTKNNMSEFQPILDELMIKYSTNLYMSPELRLTLALGALIMTVHAANSNDPRITAALHKMQSAVHVPPNTNDL